MATVASQVGISAARLKSILVIGWDILKLQTRKGNYFTTKRKNVRFFSKSHKMCKPVTRFTRLGVIWTHQALRTPLGCGPWPFLPDRTVVYPDIYPRPWWSTINANLLSYYWLCSTIGFSFAGTCFSAICFKRANRSGRNLSTRDFSMWPNFS